MKKLLIFIILICYLDSLHSMRIQEEDKHDASREIVSRLSAHPILHPIERRRKKRQTKSDSSKICRRDYKKDFGSFSRVSLNDSCKHYAFNDVIADDEFNMILYSLIAAVGCGIAVVGSYVWFIESAQDGYYGS